MPLLDCIGWPHVPRAARTAILSGVLKGRDSFLLRTSLRDRPKGPSTANHQPGGDVFGALLAVSAPATPRPHLGLLGGGEPWRPGLHRSLARGRGTAVRRGLVGGRATGASSPGARQPDRKGVECQSMAPWTEPNASRSTTRRPRTRREGHSQGFPPTPPDPRSPSRSRGAAPPLPLPTRLLEPAMHARRRGNPLRLR